MKIIYIADDGTQFENYLDCEMYEAKSEHTHLLTIDFYKEDGELYRIDNDDIYNDDPYNYAEKVIIHNLVELEDFLWLSEYCGWCEFEDWIDSPGTWIRVDDGFNAFWSLSNEETSNN